MPFYASADYESFYNITNGVVLKPGEFVIESLLGEKLSVDRDDVEKYAMPAAEAQAHVAAYQQKIESLATDLQRFAGVLQAIGTEPLDPKAIPARVDEVLQLLGVSREELRRDPKGTLSLIIQKLRATREDDILAL
jgi:hypothetical protein